MNVVIRTDASLRIGTGHVMRCLALAEVLKERGASVSFFCREFAGNLCDYIEARGFLVDRVGHSNSAGVGSVHNKQSQIDGAWLEGITWQEDAAQVNGVLDRLEHRVDWLVVDHYGLDSMWERAVRPDHCRLLVIDDLPNRPHHCDLLLDQNLKSDSGATYTALVPKGCQVFLGPSYALLRREFRELRSNLGIRDGSVRRILIFLGGCDPSDETGKVLEAVQDLGKANVGFDVIVGPQNSHRERLFARYRHSSNIIFHYNARNMANLMAQSDLAIGAGGITMWERCCMGLPSIVITVAANQESSSEALAKVGAVLYLGRKEEVTARMIGKVLAALLEVPSWVRSLSSNCRELVDGLGCERIAGEMLRGTVPKDLRFATAQS